MRDVSIAHTALLSEAFLSSHLLKSPSFPTTVIFLIISCFFDLTIADVFSVSLLKKAGGWEEVGGEREPTLEDSDMEHTHTHTPFCQIYKCQILKVEVISK